MIKTFGVGSENPGKLASVEQAGGIIFPDHEIKVLSKRVRASTVSRQPMRIGEMILGARNRSLHGLIAHSQADFGVGIESGLSEIDGVWYDSGIVLIRDKDGTESISETMKLEIGSKVMDLVRDGQELSEAVALVTGLDTVETRDCFTALTGGAISLEGTYTDAIVAALNKFAHPEYY